MVAGLLISIVIVAVLLFGYRGINSIFDEEGAIQTRTNSADAGRLIDIAQIARGLEDFASGHSGEYPQNLQILVGDQLKTLPADPNGVSYAYAVSADRRYASVYTVLETKRLYCWRSRERAAKQVEEIKFCQP